MTQFALYTANELSYFLQDLWYAFSHTRNTTITHWKKKKEEEMANKNWSTIAGTYWRFPVAAQQKLIT